MVLPVEPHARDTLLDPMSFGEGIEPLREAGQHARIVGALRGLQGLPILTLAAAKEMRVAADHLLLQRRVDVACIERAVLLTENDLEGEVQKEIAQLPREAFRGSIPDGIHHLVCLLEKVGNEGYWSLGPVPGAVFPQVADQREGAVQLSRAFEVRGLGFGRRRRLAHGGRVRRR
jgi:hypothetical protein